MTFHGGVDQPTLHAAMRRASVWAYANTGDVETYCITAVKMQAAGVIPVATDAGALREVICHDVELFPASDLPERAEDFVQGIIDALQVPPTVDERLSVRRFALEHFDWAATAKSLLRMIEKPETEVTARSARQGTAATGAVFSLSGVGTSEQPQ